MGDCDTEVNHLATALPYFDMDFNTATDRLAGCYSLDEIAVALGVSGNTVRRARMAPGSDNARPAPGGWQAKVAKLARKRASELVRLADQLERRG